MEHSTSGKWYYNSASRNILNYNYPCYGHVSARRAVIAWYLAVSPFTVDSLSSFRVNSHPHGNET